MNTTAKRPRREDHQAAPPAPSSDYRRLAPSVEPAWVEDFVLEQRILEVPGSRIGDALALVESHVAESGESAREGFGDPVTYARESAFGQPDQSEPDASWIVGMGLGLAGMLLTLFGVQEWAYGNGRVGLTVGMLVGLALGVAAFAILVLASEQVLRFVVQRFWASLGLFVLHFALLVGALLLLPTPVAEIPAQPAVAVGVTALVLGTLLEWRSRSGRQLDDPIVGPGERAHGRASWFARLTILLFPVLTALMLGFGALVGSLA